MKKQHVTLTDAERATLESLLAKGSLPAKTFKRATALLELDRGKTLTTVATTLDIDGAQRAKITALACSDAPAGHARWSLRLLAEKVVEAGFCDTISHTMVGNVLKKTN